MVEHDYRHIASRSRVLPGTRNRAARFEGISVVEFLLTPRMPKRWVVESFLAARKRATVLSCYPVSCDYTHDNLEGPSPADAFNLMLEDFGADVLLPASEGRA
jgi:hypothetical protein